MASKLTHKNAEFCRIYASNGFNGAKAYRDAYQNHDCDDLCAQTSARRLLLKDVVKKEILRLQERQQQKCDVTVQEITDYYKEIIDMCRETFDRETMRKTVNDLAKLHGLLLEEQNVTNIANIQINDRRESLAQRYVDRIIGQKQASITRKKPSQDVIDV